MYEELYFETTSFVRDPAKDTIDRPLAEEYYRTDGRRIIEKFPDDEADAAWAFNKFCSGDGAVA